MTELLIDGKRVSLPSDLSFDLIFENPYFTKSSTHTLDVDLPNTCRLIGMCSACCTVWM